MKKKVLLILLMFMFITNVKALTFNVNLTNIEDKGTGTLGTITNIDIPNKEVNALFEDIGAEISFEVTVTNSGDRAGTLRNITITSTNDKMEYTTNLPESGLAINGNDINKVTITGKVKEGATNGTSSSEIKIKYNYDEGSCPDGELLSEDESMCLCPEGKERNEQGVCIKPEKKIECKDDEIYNETKKICEKKVIPVPENPKTMDNIILITLLFIVSGLGIYTVIFKRLNTTKKKVTVGVITGVITIALSFTVLASVFGLDNLLSAIVNPITKSKELVITVNEEIDLTETWDGECSLEVSQLTPENIFEGGTGTESDPYQVKTAEQLSCFAKSINNGTTYQGQYVKQTKNIKLNDNLNDKVSTNDLSNVHLWTTAGYSEETHDENWNWFRVGNGFFGTYDGDNHIISGLYITDASKYNENCNSRAMFAYTKNATFKNMTFTDTYIHTTGYDGGATLVGYAYENLTLNNINTYGTGYFYDERDNYKTSNNAGIIAIYDANNVGSLVIENTTNNMDLTCEGTCSGVVQKAQKFGNSESNTLVLKNVTNKGNITFVSSAYGSAGILGYCDYDTNVNALVENVTNKGNITFDSTDTDNGGSIGGIFGRFSGYKAVIKNSHNEGNITGFNTLSELAGMIGMVNYFDELTIENCYNSGDIIATYTTEDGSSYAAGIVGGGSGNEIVSIKNCYNTGDINSPNSRFMAGIFGKDESSSGPKSDKKIENCYNTGDFIGSHSVAGIVGQFRGQIIKSYNTGDMTTLDDGMIGGLVGYGYSDIYNSYNIGNITLKASSALAGGLCSMDCNITNSYNRGDIIVETPNDYVGGDISGIVAQYGTVKNVYNSGNILVKSKCSAIVSGIGYDGTRENTYNLGNITIESTLPGIYVGGLGTGGTVKDSVNAGNISLDSTVDYTSEGYIRVGGILGYSGSSINNFNAGTISIADSILNNSYVTTLAGEISSDYGSSHSGNKWNTNPNGKALGCTETTDWTACTIEQSQAAGSYSNEVAPDILGIINGDDAFEVKEGDTLPTLKVFNQ